MNSILNEIRHLDKENFQILNDVKTTRIIRQMEWESFESILIKERDKLILMIVIIERQCRDSFFTLYESCEKYLKSWLRQLTKFTIKNTNYLDKIIQYWTILKKIIETKKHGT